MLAKDQTTTQYETEMKRRFIEEPANLKLLIVVSKLLTGFDAPSCTYIYLDNELRDHNLFQAICRTNRLDGDDKDYGHVVDYKELFSKVQDAIAVYTSDELDTETVGDDGNVIVKDWREEGKAQLDAAREALMYLCAPVKQPQGIEQHIQYFCGDAVSPTALNDTEPLRIAFYKAVAAFVRAYADLAPNLAEAGYGAAEIKAFEEETQFYTELRAAIKNHSGEELDIKPFEADMRHLINTYIQADPADLLGDLSELSLTELIIDTGIHDAIAKKLNQKGKLSNNAVAESIINNVRKTIIRDQLTDPMFYAEMSKLLDDLIAQKRDDTVSYEQFLKNAEALAKQLGKGKGEQGVPAALHGNKEATVLYNNLPDVLAASVPANTAAEPTPPWGDEYLGLALKLDKAIREKAPAGWKGDPAREAQVLNAIAPILSKNKAATLAMFEIIKNQPGY
ncbi:type I restriction enzyme subunit R domain-containing protein [Hydrogenophaga sp.]|uniref:type I restriction enzyme subunit R domain-containing protein n=1 Tax=Hydrogenophaga sp. TaxID=1904254 RepID=UPI003F6CAF07